MPLENSEKQEIKSQKPVIQSQNQKPWWKEKLEYTGFVFAIFGIPAILYLAIRNLSENNSFLVFFIVLVFALWLFENKYEEVKRLKRQIKILLEHSDYSSNERAEIVENLDIMDNSKIKKFQRDANNFHIWIRREFFINGKVMKEIIFRIDDLYIRSLGYGENPDLESDGIIKKERQGSIEGKVVYEWESGIGFQNINL